MKFKELLNISDAGVRVHIEVCIGASETVKEFDGFVRDFYYNKQKLNDLYVEGVNVKENIMLIDLNTDWTIY